MKPHAKRNVIDQVIFVDQFNKVRDTFKPVAQWFFNEQVNRTPGAFGSCFDMKIRRIGNESNIGPELNASSSVLNSFISRSFPPRPVLYAAISTSKCSSSNLACRMPIEPSPKNSIFFFSVILYGGPSTIYSESRPGYIGGCVSKKKDYRACNLLGVCHASK